MYSGSSNPIRILIFAALLTVTALGLRAQSDAQFTQYYEIPAYYNPAAIGLTDNIHIRGGSRLQWVGIDHAPVTFAAMADMPFKLFSKRWGVGVVLQQESIGLYNNINANVQAGYKFKALKGNWTVGLTLGLLDKKFKGSEVYIPEGDDYHETTDDAIPRTDVHGTAFDIGAGIWYTHPKFYVGLSGLHLNSPVVTFQSDNGETSGGTSGGSSADGGATESAKNYEFQTGRTLYFTAGSNIPIKNTLFELMPSLMVKSDFTFTTAEVTARVRYNRFLTAGLGYRYNDAVSIVLGAEIKGFFLGYSYDYPVSSVAKASSGSHEIFTGYSLKLDLGEKNKNKHKSIRIM